MYINRVIEPHIIWYFSWKPLLFTTTLSAAVFVVYHYLNFKMISLPFLPIATVGTAVAFYVGFKNNSSYDRMWESRKIWGEITNLSRSLASYLLAVMPPAQSEERKEFVYRHLAFINMLRIQLRRRNVWDDHHEYTRLSRVCFETIPYETQADEALNAVYSPEEIKALIGKNNVATEILHQQMKRLTDFRQADWIDGFDHANMMNLCNELYAQQGKAERIKTFPFPRQYAFFSEFFVYIFVCLLPFGLIGEFDKISGNHDWLVIPFTNLISWIFITMEKVGDSSENPFEGSLHDIPMSTICRNIEIDLKGMLKEDNLPQPLQPDEFILL